VRITWVVAKNVRISYNRSFRKDGNQDGCRGLGRDLDADRVFPAPGVLLPDDLAPHAGEVGVDGRRAAGREHDVHVRANRNRQTFDHIFHLDDVVTETEEEFSILNRHVEVLVRVVTSGVRHAPGPDFLGDRDHHGDNLVITGNADREVPQVDPLLGGLVLDQARHLSEPPEVRQGVVVMILLHRVPFPVRPGLWD
jgi:hypothetical protein